MNCILKSDNLMNSKRYVKLMFLATLIEILFFWSNEFNSSGIGLVACLLMMGYCGLKEIDLNFYMLLFLLPNQRYIVFPGSDTTLLNIIIVIIFFKIITKNRKFYKSILIMSILVSLLGVNIWIRFGTFSEIATLVKGSLTVFTVIYVLKTYITDKEFYFKCINFLGFGCLTAALITFLLSGEFVIGTKLRFSGGDNNNANIFGAMISYSVASLMITDIVKKNSSKTRILAVLLLVIFGLLTQSRSFILCIGVTCVYILCFGFLYNKKARNIILLMILSIIIGIVFSIIFPESVIGKIINSAILRIIKPRNGDLSNGRLELWFAYIQFLFNNIEYLLLGIGNGWYRYGFDNVAHNGLIEVVTAYGIIGTGMILALLLNALKLIKNLYVNTMNVEKIKISALYYLPLIILLITNITGHNFFNLSFIIQILISFAGVYSLSKYKLEG